MNDRTDFPVESARASNPMALAPGVRLGPYAITASIGAGGMGEVYEATDTRLIAAVAVKVLPEHVASNPELKKRFEREAKTLAGLSHPHICPVFDVESPTGPTSWSWSTWKARRSNSD